MEVYRAAPVTPFLDALEDHVQECNVCTVEQKGDDEIITSPCFLPKRCSLSVGEKPTEAEDKLLCMLCDLASFAKRFGLVHPRVTTVSGLHHWMQISGNPQPVYHRLDNGDWQCALNLGGQYIYAHAHSKREALASLIEMLPLLIHPKPEDTLVGLVAKIHIYGDKMEIDVSNPRGRRIQVMRRSKDLYGILVRMSKEIR